MKVEIGWDFESTGTVELTPDGIVLTGDKKSLQRLLDSMRGNLSDKELVASLPSRLTGRTWAKALDFEPEYWEG